MEFFYINQKKKKKEEEEEEEALIMHIERVMLVCVYHLYMIKSTVIFFELFNKSENILLMTFHSPVILFYSILVSTTLGL